MTHLTPGDPFYPTLPYGLNLSAIVETATLINISRVDVIAGGTWRNSRKSVAKRFKNSTRFYKSRFSIIDKIFMGNLPNQVIEIHELMCFDFRLENDRIGKIRSTFTTYGGILESIAHLMPEDVSRILDSEATLINATIINNSRAYGDLFMRLMTADIEVNFFRSLGRIIDKCVL